MAMELCELKRKSAAIDYDPRPKRFRNNENNQNFLHNYCAAFQNSMMPIKQALRPANPYAIELDHDYSKYNPKFSFLDKLKLLGVTSEDVKNIESATRGQTNNLTWHEYRECRITSSQFYEICHTNGNEDENKNLGQSLVNKTTSVSMTGDHNITNEDAAIRKFLEKHGATTNEEVTTCGLFIVKTHPYLGASPSRLFRDNAVLEIKCPHSAHLKEISPQTVPYLQYDTTGALELIPDHQVSYQIQGKLLATGREYCFLIIYTVCDVQVIEIKRDDLFISNMVERLEEFYSKYFLPELLEKHYYKYYSEYKF